MNNPETRRNLRNSLGYCRNHSIQLIALVENSYNRLGASIIFEDIANESIRKLENLINKKFKRINFENEKNLCPACKYQKKLGKIYIYEFEKCMEDNFFYEAFNKNRSLCFKHMGELIKSSKNISVLKKIFEVYKLKIEKDIGLIYSFIKKNDYRNKENILPEEAEAWKEAIKKIKGDIMINLD